MYSYLKLMMSTDYSLVTRLERFIFAPVNPTYAGVFRILLTLMLAAVFWPRRGLSLEGYNIPGLLYFFEHLSFPYWFFILVLLILFGTGLMPRLLGVILVVLLLPLSFQTGLHASCQLLLFTLLFFSLLRSNAGPSLWTGKAESHPVSVGPMWPIRLIQLQLSVMYGVNAVAKTTPEYLSGQVLMGMSKMLPNFVINLSDGYLHLGPLAIPVTLLAIASVMTEYILAIGFWFPRFRIATAVFGVFFHIGLKFIIRVGMLDWTSIFLYLAFLLPFDRPLISEIPEKKKGHSEPDYIPTTPKA